MRRLLILPGLALLMLATTAALASAQDAPPTEPTPIDITNIPKVDDPPASYLAPPVPKAEEPQTDGLKVDAEVSPNTGMPRLDAPAEEKKNYTIADLTILSSDWIDPRYVENSSNPDKIGIWEKFRDGYGGQIHRLVQDYKNFYLSENICYVGLAVGVAAPLANTRVDQNINTWYQRQTGSSSGANNAARVFNSFGEAGYVITGSLLLATAGHLFPDSDHCTTLGDFGDRTWRALAVGAPMIGILQYGLGSEAPDLPSRWQPGHSNHGASSEAFVGAVPFLTAASMTDNTALQAALFVGSLGAVVVTHPNQRPLFLAGLPGLVGRLAGRPRRQPDRSGEGEPFPDRAGRYPARRRPRRADSILTFSPRRNQ